MKIVARLGQLIAGFPSAPTVLSLRRQLLARDHVRVPATGPERIAIEGLEDPFYYGLFATIQASLRERIGARGEIVFVHSISGAIGVSWRAAILRSVLLRWLLSNQWMRAFRPMLDNVAYRSVSLAHPVGDAFDLFRSVRVWRKLRSADRFELHIEGVPVHDLINDSYLRFRPAAQFDIRDPFVLRLIWQSYRDVRRANRYFGRLRPLLYLTSYSTYIEHGIPVRVALRHRVPVFSFGNFNRLAKRLTLSDWYHSPSTDHYRADFSRLTEPKSRLAEAEAHLNARLAGHIDAAMSYMRASAYANEQSDIPDVGGAVIVFMHDFYDSPHIYPDLVFEDFWSWVCCTIETLNSEGIAFLLKPHPNQVSLSDEATVRLRARYPDVRFLPSDVSNVQLAKAGICCGVTMYGSVAHELAYLGIPSIACAKHVHHAFDFCRTARTRDEYIACLRTPSLMPIDAPEMRKQALMFYYMHNLHGSAEELDVRARFLSFWKACHDTTFSEADLLRAYQRFCEAPGVRSMIEDFAALALRPVPSTDRSDLLPLER